MNLLLLLYLFLTNVLYGNAYVMSDGFTGKLPTLGWNSWNAYYCDITEEHFLTAARVFVDSGLKDFGYNYVNIDDCWMMKDGRDGEGHLVPNTTRFPDGIKGLADKIHDMGLNFGLYSCAGSETCAGYPASLEHEETDAADFAAWGVDYLKYDNCNVPEKWKDEYQFCAPETHYMNVGENGTCSREDNPNMAPDDYDWSVSNTAKRYGRMRDALAKQERDILFSLCVWGTGGVYKWGNDTGISWRMSDDIFPNWPSILRIININSFRLHYVNFWGRNDADMLVIGNGITPAESRSHFALWAAMKSPLLIGTDLAKLSKDDLKILTNQHLLAFNQDSVYGAPAMPYKWGANPDWTFNETWPAQYWAGDSQLGTLMLFFNPGDTSMEMSTDISEIPGLNGKPHLAIDVWSDEEIGCVSGSLSKLVDPHDTAILLLTVPCNPSTWDAQSAAVGSFAGWTWGP